MKAVPKLRPYLQLGGLRHDFPIIAAMVPANSRVLDIGCGDGDLLQFLQLERNVARKPHDYNYAGLPPKIHL